MLCLSGTLLCSLHLLSCLSVTSATSQYLRVGGFVKAVGPARKVVVLALHPDTWQSGPVVIPARAVAPRGFWDARHASSLGALCQHRAEAEPLSLCRDRLIIPLGPRQKNCDFEDIVTIARD